MDYCFQSLLLKIQIGTDRVTLGNRLKQSMYIIYIYLGLKARLAELEKIFHEQAIALEQGKKEVENLKKNINKKDLQIKGKSQLVEFIKVTN